MTITEQVIVVGAASVVAIPALAAGCVWLGLDADISTRLALTQVAMAFGVTSLLGAAVAWVSSTGDPSVLVRNRD
jgi:hypothetical protein